MVKNCLIILFLLKSILSFSQENFSIEGKILGAKNETLVELIAFNYGETTLMTSKVINEKVVFKINKGFKEGVYKINIRYGSELLNLNQVYFFYVIIDKTENKISFDFDPTKSAYPNILLSNINMNWYNFLKLEDFRIKVINEVKNSIEFKSSNLSTNAVRLKEILDTESSELIAIRSKYLRENYNKWSTEMVKNKFNLLYHKNTTKDNYWSQFETHNLELINTPIYQELILSYIVMYFKGSNEEGYKAAFEKVIEVFSFNLEMKEWVVKYLIAGISSLKNQSLLSYFNSKYKLKVESIIK